MPKTKQEPEKQQSAHRIEKPSLLASQGRLAIGRPPTKDKPLIISVSELRDWLRCRVKHHWRHQCRLEPLQRAEPLAMGTLGHQMLEGWYGLPLAKRTVKAMEKAAITASKNTTETSLSADDRDLLIAMCTGYAEWAGPLDAEEGIGDVTPETEFDFPLTLAADIRVRGKIDTMYRSTNSKKTVGCHEHKFKSRIDTGAIELNMQLSTYLWALRQITPGMLTYRAHFNILRKQRPGPRVTGELFFRENIERTDEEIAQWADDTRRAVLDMYGAAVYPNPMDSCKWDCDFQGPCLLRGDAEALRDVLDSQYKPREKRS